MKKIYLFYGVIFFSLATNAQQGVTKYGTGALANNTSTGIYNSAFGYYALNINTTGTKNTAMGANVLRANNGSYNTGIGYASLYKNTSGYENGALGLYALFSNTTGYYNTALGTYALQANTTAYYNTAVGYKALYSNTDQSYNTAIGPLALYTNYDGVANTAVGYRTLYANTSGLSNTGMGHAALYLNTTGSNNAALSRYALYSNTSGGNNTAVGYEALYTNITGSNNTALGAFADVSTSSLVNATAIGYNAKVNASNKVRVGSTSVSSIGGQVGWTTFSDGRYKKDIRENIPGLAFINSLRPVSYTINIHGLDEFYGQNKNKIPDDVKSSAASNTEFKQGQEEAAKMIYSGFVAQEVEQAAKKLDYAFSGVDKPKNNNDLYGLRYADFVVPLVKAVQELSKKNDEKDALIADLQKQMNELKSLISTAGQPGNNTAVLVGDASIQQNIPNPVSNTTMIHYTLPKSYSSAKIIITDRNGKTLKDVAIKGTGNGNVTINTSGLIAGNYNYSLYINGRIVETKQMMISK